MALRRLGIDRPAGKDIELIHGHVGKFFGEDELVACTAMGVSWGDDEESVDPDTICAATFAVFVNRE